MEKTGPRWGCATTQRTVEHTQAGAEMFAGRCAHDNGWRLVHCIGRVVAPPETHTSHCDMDSFRCSFSIDTCLSSSVSAMTCSSGVSLSSSSSSSSLLLLLLLLLLLPPPRPLPLPALPLPRPPPSLASSPRFSFRVTCFLTCCCCCFPCDGLLTPGCLCAVTAAEGEEEEEEELCSASTADAAASALASLHSPHLPAVQGSQCARENKQRRSNSRTRAAAKAHSGAVSSRRFHAAGICRMIAKATTRSTRTHHRHPASVWTRSSSRRGRNRRTDGTKCRAHRRYVRPRTGVLDLLVLGTVVAELRARCEGAVDSDGGEPGLICAVVGRQLEDWRYSCNGTDGRHAGSIAAAAGAINGPIGQVVLTGCTCNDRRNLGVHGPAQPSARRHRRSSSTSSRSRRASSLGRVARGDVEGAPNLVHGLRNPATSGGSATGTSTMPEVAEVDQIFKMHNLLCASCRRAVDCGDEQQRRQRSHS
jgi:hypothetical protein